MKKSIAGLVVGSLVAFTGCNQSGPGGPGATPASKRSDSATSSHAPVTPKADMPSSEDSARKTVAVNKKDTFELAQAGLGLGSTSVKQGATETINLKVKRQDAFKETVSLAFKDDKGGLKFEAIPAKVAPNEKGEIQLKVTADDKTALGKHEVIVTGTPDAGEPVTLKLSIDVKAK